MSCDKEPEFVGKEYLGHGGTSAGNTLAMLIRILKRAEVGASALLPDRAQRTRIAAGTPAIWLRLRASLEYGQTILKLQRVVQLGNQRPVCGNARHGAI